MQRTPVSPATPATWEAEFNAPGISSYEEMDWFIEPVKAYAIAAISLLRRGVSLLSLFATRRCGP
jgi:hypothetical protein